LQKAACRNHRTLELGGAVVVQPVAFVREVVGDLGRAEDLLLVVDGNEADVLVSADSEDLTERFA
jgi:hypothetical protein